MKLLLKIAFLSILTECAHAETLYGIEMQQHYNAPIKGSVYVQMGSFTKKPLAVNYQGRLQEKTKTPVVIKSVHNAYKVLVGPFENQASLKGFAKALTPVWTVSQKTKPVIDTESKPVESVVPAAVSEPLAVAQSFVTVQAGGAKIRSLSATTVHNGSGYSAPYDQDIYSTHQPGMNTVLGVQLGHRMVIDRPYVSTLSVGVAYQYFFAPNLSGEVTQFSLPEFTNYTYSWKVASSLVSAHAKLNGPVYHRFSPYVNGGLGVVYSKSQYSETALGDVTPRLSPNYGSLGAQFAYVLGAGIDYTLRPQQLILSAGYQFSSLGTFNSGYGSGRWLNERLNLGTNQSNAFILGLTYFI